MNRALRLIVNGKAAGSSALRSAVGVLRQSGVPIEVRVTWEQGDAERLAAAAAAEDVDVVVACGGDGTVGEVVNGLMTADAACPTALAIIPFGTANDFATGCGIPKGDPLAALQLAASGAPRKIDVGRANDRYFVNVASGGFGALVTASTPTQMKKVLGGAAYSLMGLVTAAKMTPYRGKLVTPDNERHGAMILMAVGNGRLAGGGYPVAPKALLNDGLLDCMAVLDADVRDFGVLLTELMTLGAPDNRFVIYRQLPSFRIESETPLHMNLDGEPVVAPSFDFQVFRERLPFIAPAECELLTRG